MVTKSKLIRYWKMCVFSENEYGHVLFIVKCTKWNLFWFAIALEKMWNPVYDMKPTDLPQKLMPKNIEYDKRKEKILRGKKQKKINWNTTKTKLNRTFYHHDPITIKFDIIILWLYCTIDKCKPKCIHAKWIKCYCSCSDLMFVLYFV